MLQKTNKYNDLSEGLRKWLNKRIESFGERVRYKFDISNPNPDPERKGSILYPNAWTLDPVTFKIIDNDENDSSKSKLKDIGIVTKTDDKGNPIEFKRIRIFAADMGLLDLDLKNADDIEIAMCIELHPKLAGGKFADSAKRQLITRVDELAAAKTKRTERTDRVKALNVAQSMSDADLIQFADAMAWDSTEVPDILRDKVEELAEKNPKLFNDLVSSKAIEYQAIVKQAMNKKLISFDPAEYQFIWVGNNQPIASLPPTSDKNEIEKMGEWLQSADKGNETFKKLKSLIGTK